MDPEDKELLSDALTGGDTPAADPPTQETPPVEPQAGAPSGEQPRDELGRFATKSDEPAASPTYKDALPADTTPKPAATDTQDHRVPLRELLDEREKRQKHEREVSDLRAQLDYLSRLVAQGQHAPRDRQTGQPAEQKTIWDDPDAYFRSQIDPLRQEAEMAIFSVKEGFSRRMAIKEYGKEVVDAAFQEMSNLMRVGQGQHDYQRIMASDDPFDELVQWHKQRQNMALIGNDPNGWLEKQLQERMKDPAFQAKVIELARGQAASPTNGSGGPKVQLPPSLSRTPAAMGVVADEGLDESDAALLKSTLRR